MLRAGSGHHLRRSTVNAQPHLGAVNRVGVPLEGHRPRFGAPRPTRGAVRSLGSKPGDPWCRRDLDVVDRPHVRVGALPDVHFLARGEALGFRARRRRRRGQRMIFEVETQRRCALWRLVLAPQAKGVHAGTKAAVDAFFRVVRCRGSGLAGHDRVNRNDRFVESEVCQAGRRMLMAPLGSRRRHFGQPHGAADGTFRYPHHQLVAHMVEHLSLETAGCKQNADIGSEGREGGTVGRRDRHRAPRTDGLRRDMAGLRDRNIRPNGGVGWRHEGLIERLIRRWQPWRFTALRRRGWRVRCRRRRLAAGRDNGACGDQSNQQRTTRPLEI